MKKQYILILLLILILGAFFFINLRTDSISQGLSNNQRDKINETSQEFKDLIRPTIFNIEDFGASIDNKDNSDALQAAIDAAILTSTELRSDNKWDIYVGKVYNDDWMRDRGFLESDVTVSDLIRMKDAEPFISVQVSDSVRTAMNIMK